MSTKILKNLQFFFKARWQRKPTSFFRKKSAFWRQKGRKSIRNRNRSGGINCVFVSLRGLQSRPWQSQSSKLTFPPPPFVTPPSFVSVGNHFSKNPIASYAQHLVVGVISFQLYILIPKSVITSQRVDKPGPSGLPAHRTSSIARKIFRQNNQTYKATSSTRTDKENGQRKPLYTDGQRPKVRLCVNDCFCRQLKHGLSKYPVHLELSDQDSLHHIQSHFYLGHALKRNVEGQLPYLQHFQQAK